MEKRINDLSKASGTGAIPIASAETLGGIKVPADSGITITGSGNAYVPKPIDFSSNEVNTGKKWIDGKPIYEKTISLGALPNNSEIQVDHNITFDRVIDYIAIAQNSAGTVLKLPFLSPTEANNVGATINATKVTVFTGSDRSGFTGYCTIQYTKPTEETTQ